MARKKTLNVGNRIGEHFFVFNAKPGKEIPAGTFGRYSPSAVDPGWYEAAADTRDNRQVTQFGHSPEELIAAVEAYEADQAARGGRSVFEAPPVSSRVKTIG